MPANFTELLDANRLRPLWGPGRPTPVGDADRPPQLPPGEELDGPAAGAVAELIADDPNDQAPSEPVPPETPLQLLDKLDQLLRIVLGPQAMLLNIYLMPLRRVLSRLEGRPAPPHPLQSALQTNNLPLLIYHLEDAFRGLLRTTQGLRR